MSERWILHADMDAFFAAVEQLDNPALRGKPILVGHDSPRSVVSTASYEARPFGVGSAMPMLLAKRKCPQAIIVPPRYARYQEVSARVMSVFARFSPAVESLSLDEAFLDMTGAELVFGPPERMGRLLKDAVKEATGGLTVSVGIAPTKYVAKVASDLRKPDGLTVVHASEVTRFLAPLPVRRLWGVGPKSAEQLERLKLHTVGDVARADPVLLWRELGRFGEHIAALARGIDPREVEPVRVSKSVGHEETLVVDITQRTQAEPILLRAADIVAERLRAEGLAACGVRVKLKTASFKLHSRQAALARATDSADPLYSQARELLASFDWSEPMRLVGLTAIQLTSRHAASQGELFAPAAELKHKTLDRAVDALRAKFGRGVVKRASQLEEEDDESRPRK